MSADVFRRRQKGARAESGAPGPCARGACLRIASAAAVLAIAACSGGDGSTPGAPPAPAPAPAPSPPPPPPPPSAGGTAFQTPSATARFLTQATFGPTDADITTLTGTSASDWFLAELAAPATLNLDYVLTALAQPDAINQFGDVSFETKQTPGFSFWINAVSAPDQLRQRMAYALSQIFVISHAEGGNLFDLPQTVAHFQDILVRNAFGNFRDLLEEVTYSPAMGEYLTYLQNQKGFSVSVRVPYENFAR